MTHYIPKNKEALIDQVIDSLSINRMATPHTKHNSSFQRILRPTNFASSQKTDVSHKSLLLRPSQQLREKSKRNVVVGIDGAEMKSVLHPEQLQAAVTGIQESKQYPQEVYIK